jgi:hypothetical protein
VEKASAVVENCAVENAVAENCANSDVVAIKTSPGDM